MWRAAVLVALLLARPASAQDYTILAISHLDNKVSEIDPRSGRTLRAFILPGEWFGELHEGAVMPDNRSMFVSVPYLKQVIRLDLETLKPTETIESEFFTRPKQERSFARIGKRESTSSDPHGVALTRDGKKLYITVEFAEVPGIVVYDVEARTIIKKIDTVIGGNYLWVHPRNGKLYMPSRDDRVIVVDTKTDRIVRVIAAHAGSRPNGVDFGGPNGEVWVNADGDGSVLVIDAETDVILKTIRPPSKGPGRVAVSPNGRWAASAHGRDVSLIDTTSKAIVATLPFSPESTGHGFPLFSPDSRMLHVMSEFTNDMVNIDVQTMTQVGDRIPVGGASFGGGIRLLR